MPGLVEEATKIRSEVSELREAGANDKANVPVMNGLQKEVSASKKTVAEFLLAVEKCDDLRVAAEKMACLSKIEFEMIKHREKFFDKAVAGVNKEVSAARLEFAA